MGLPGGRGGHGVGPGGSGELRQKWGPRAREQQGCLDGTRRRFPEGRRLTLHAHVCPVPRARAVASPNLCQEEKTRLSRPDGVLIPAQNKGSDFLGSWEQPHPNSHLCPHPWPPSPLPARHGPL